MTEETSLQPRCLVPARQTVPRAVVSVLEALGVRLAFGVSGGGVAAIWDALSASGIAVRHFRHEAGAAFAATEASLATGRPVVVFVTTGPGVANALTGVMAARSEGGQVILVSACTTPAQLGRWAIQETGPATMPAGLYADGPVFDVAAVLGAADELGPFATRLARALGASCVAHLAIPTGLFAQSAEVPAVVPAAPTPPAPDTATLARCAAALDSGRFAIWLGHGARGAADEIRALAEHCGAPVFCSPRGKGIFPEDHPLFAGVTGMGGHEAVRRTLALHAPARVLVLGSRLGEPTSFWHPALVPPEGFVHVDTDPRVPGQAYPDAPTIGVTADARAFAAAILPLMTQRAAPAVSRAARPCPPAEAVPVRPEALMAAIQSVVIDASDAPVLAESGNSFTWATHFLRFATPRYRVSTQLGAMGHCAAGVVGVALARAGKAVAIVGDGAMLMNNEINTAAKYGAQAVWIVLNDARYNMCVQGMASLGLAADAEFPEVDFAAVALAMGGDGEVVAGEAGLVAALHRAMAAPGPYLLDIRIDPSCAAPALGRNQGLRTLTAGPGPQGEISFPGAR